MARVKIVVTVPETHADQLREAMGKAGAGRLGNYSLCSFSINGTGRFLPNAQAHPAVGQPGKLESVAEERIEVTCDREVLPAVVTAINTTHPYEEVALDIYPLEDIP